MRIVQTLFTKRKDFSDIILYFTNNCFPASPGDESQILEIEDVVLHPMYDLSNAYQDIAVIKLKPNKSKSFERTIFIA